MTARDKWGVAILISLFALLILVLVWTVKPTGPSSHSPGESPIVKQRIINLQKSGK
jgi:hypothetical protein